MGLTSDIEKAFSKSIGIEEGSDKGKVPQLAKDLSEAIVTFLTEQTFTVTELKASVEIEEFKTTSPISGDVATTQVAGTYKILLDMLSSLPVVGTTIKGMIDKIISMIPKTMGKGEVTTAINLSKYEGLTATGHAYVGPKARNVPGSDTIEELNTFTKVKLDPDKIVEA